LGDHFRRRRLDLGLLQRIVAERLGVREETITNWELGRQRPRVRHHAEILRLLGYDPDPAGDGLPDRLRAVRRRLGLTQTELAVRLGQDEAHVCRWERGQRTPHLAIAGRINLALRALEGHPLESGFEQPSYFDLTPWRRWCPVGVAIRPRTLGDRLRARRLALGLTATSVARQTGTSRGTLYRIERGRKTPSTNLKLKLRAILDLDGD
jgi:transcriptional regulator with XRE-family HTH domain